MGEKERVLDFLKRTAKAIAVMFGGNCETLIHDMAAPGHPLVAIYNSHISGREEGSTASIFGDDLGAVTTREYTQEDAINTFALTSTGRHIKSTTIQMRGKNYFYALGINYDYTGLMPAVDILASLTQTGSNLDDLMNSKHRLEIEEIFEDCMSSMGKPLSKMKKPDKMQLVSMLLDRKAFNLQKSVSYVAEQLSVSRYTVYKYIHEIENDKT